MEVSTPQEALSIRRLMAPDQIHVRFLWQPVCGPSPYSLHVGALPEQACFEVAPVCAHWHIGRGYSLRQESANLSMELRMPRTQPPMSMLGGTTAQQVKAAADPVCTRQLGIC